MIRDFPPFEGKRHIGDNRLKIYHDAVHEVLGAGFGGCRIERIPAEEVRTFEPDTSQEARRKGFVPCPFCRHGEERRPESRDESSGLAAGGLRRGEPEGPL
jgi:hypothetical protein